jgi:hypothetical protein
MVGAGALLAVCVVPALIVVPAGVPATSPVAAAGGANDIANGGANDGAWREPAVQVDQVVLVGDSLAQEVFPTLQTLLPQQTVVPKFWGGTAPCDWVANDLQATPSTIVVISFTGNSLTSCMSDDAGVLTVDQPLVEKYRADIGTLIDSARRMGARVVLVGQPLRAPSFDADFEVNAINEAYRGFAAAFPYVSFVDAGSAVETPDGAYTDRLPCTEFDTDCAPDGTTIVRGDGVHFCPMAEQAPCPVWSSGAFRFALQIASAVERPADYDEPAPAEERTTG